MWNSDGWRRARYWHGCRDGTLVLQCRRRVHARGCAKLGAASDRRASANASWIEDVLDRSRGMPLWFAAMPARAHSAKQGFGCDPLKRISGGTKVALAESVGNQLICAGSTCVSQIFLCCFNLWAAGCGNWLQRKRDHFGVFPIWARRDSATSRKADRRACFCFFFLFFFLKQDVAIRDLLIVVTQKSRTIPDT